MKSFFVPRTHDMKKKIDRFTVSFNVWALSWWYDYFIFIAKCFLVNDSTSLSPSVSLCLSLNENLLSILVFEFVYDPNFNQKIDTPTNIRGIQTPLISNSLWTEYEIFCLVYWKSGRLVWVRLIKIGRHNFRCDGQTWCVDVKLAGDFNIS